MVRPWSPGFCPMHVLARENGRVGAARTCIGHAAGACQNMHWCRENGRVGAACCRECTAFAHVALVAELVHDALVARNRREVLEGAAR